MACAAHDEQLARPDVEERLDRHARVGAAHDNGPGLLVLGEPLALGGREVRALSPLGEALVACTEQVECDVCWMAHGAIVAEHVA